MRVFLGAVVVVVLVVGGFWFALSQLVGRSRNDADAFTKSSSCVAKDPALVRDSADAAGVAAPGLRTIGLRWNGFRAVALFARTPRAAGREELKLASELEAGRLPCSDRAACAAREVRRHVLVSSPPTQAAQAALGRCIYLIRPNRFASFFGLNITHTERPFVPGADRDRR